jgi:hypothetical protein
MHKQVWKGVDSDNDSYISSDQGADDVDNDDDDDVAEFEPILEADANVDDDDDDDHDDAESKEETEKRAKKEAKKAKDKERRRAIRNEVAELKDQLDDESKGQKTPIVGESIADFYARTTQYWDEVVTKSSTEEEQVETTNQGESILTKDMIECEGFHLANVRYEEVKQIRERLAMLERLQLEYDEKKAKKKSDKKLKKDRLR